MIDPNQLKIYFEPRIGGARDIRVYFTTGLLVMLPIAATVAVIMWLLRGLNNYLLSPMLNMAWVQAINIQIPEGLKPWVFGSIGLIVIFLAIAGLGMLATNVVGRVFINWVDVLLRKVPFVNTIYTFIQGLADNLSMMKSGTFQKVVLVEFPKEGVYSVGFVAGDLAGSLKDAAPGDKIAVFVPTSPNPTSGFIVVVNNDEAIPLDMTPEDGLKFIVSGGVLMPEAVKPEVKG